MPTPRLKDRKELTEDWIRRFLTYTDDDGISWFGASSIMRAWAITTGALVEGVYLLYVALLRRFTLFSSADEDLAVVAAERGSAKLGSTRAKVLVVIQPFSANVDGITLGATDLIEVDDTSQLSVGDSIRIRNGTGVTSEIKTIVAITIGTGPVNGNDELEVSSLVNVYTPAVDDVDVLRRVLVTEGTLTKTDAGIEFQTVENVTTGDFNAVLDGEGTFLGLADKVWSEAVVRGASGGIEPRTITQFSAGAIDGIVDVFNPERSTGNADVESDFELKKRTINGPAITGQETAAWFEALAKVGNEDVLRVVRPTETALGTIIMRLLNRNGGPFTATQLSDLETYLEARMRSAMTVQLENVILTSVEIDAQLNLESEASLEAVWKEYSNRAAAFLDYRKRNFGDDADNDDLRKILEDVPGVASVDKDSFRPAADVPVADLSLPKLTRISLLELTTSETINAGLTQAF